MLILAATLVLLTSFAGAAKSPSELVVLHVPAAQKVPLTAALSQIGLHVQGGYVVFGVDIRGENEPVIDLNLEDQTSLSQALNQVVSQLHGYNYEFVSNHVVDIFPADRRADPNDILNLSVSEFQVSDQPAMNILSQPQRFIPELKRYLIGGKTSKTCGSLGPGIGSFGSEVTLNLRHTTVKDILDAVAVADSVLSAHLRDHTQPIGWIHREIDDPRAGTTHTWSFLSTVPHGWEKFMPEETTH